MEGKLRDLDDGDGTSTVGMKENGKEVDGGTERQLKEASGMRRSEMEGDWTGRYVKRRNRKKAERNGV